ncbi:hypothetical protein ACOME3_007158 [Neoechinorhynchus agilis]
MNNNGNLCRSLVKAGARLAVINDAKVSIFNFDLPTKNLLYSMLDSLQREPPWAEYEFCMSCEMPFTMTTRRHHWYD